MKPIGTLTLTFMGLPVPLAISPFADYSDLSFKSVCSQGHNLAYVRKCATCNKEIPFNELKSAFEIDKNNRIVFEKSLVAKLKEQFKETSIVKVMPVADTLSMKPLIDKAYYLMPKKSLEKGYYLLREALQQGKYAIIIDYALRSRKRLGLVEVANSQMLLYNLLYYEQVRKAIPFDEIKVSEKDMENGKLLLETIKEDTKDVQFADIKDEYKKAVLDAVVNKKEVAVKEKEDDLSKQLEIAVKKRRKS